MGRMRRGPHPSHYGEWGFAPHIDRVFASGQNAKENRKNPKILLHRHEF